MVGLILIEVKFCRENTEAKDTFSYVDLIRRSY